MENNVSIIKKDECCGCTGCKNICPKGAITMKQDSEGFLYPYVDRKKCINCGLCLNMCKNKNSNFNKKQDIKVYAAKNKSDEVLKQSSSGGISGALCEYFIKNGGIVYGVVYNEKFEVVVEREDTLKKTEKLYGAKYVWANPKDTYIEVYKDLKNNKTVLFIATSCFVAGLKSFLTLKKCSLDNLYTVDLICHGTPSPKLFSDYINYLKGKYKFDHFSFRTKIFPWGYGSKNYGCAIYKKNGKYIVDTVDSRLFLKLFFSDYALRPYCHNCEFATINKPSDITIGDYWGIKNEHPDFFDENGVSSVIVHTNRGNEIIKKLNNITYIDSTIEKVSKKQVNLTTPSTKKNDRDLFWNLYYKKGFKAVCRKYANLNAKVKIKTFIKNKLIKYRLMER